MYLNSLNTSSTFELYSQSKGKCFDYSKKTYHGNSFYFYLVLYIYIKKLISVSKLKIMTINGYLVKEFNLSYNENIIRWDGRDESGQLLSTGIYYITSYKNSNSISEKIAIIRN